MSASFYDLQKFAATGIASPEMTHYDKMRALSMAGGKIETLTGVPPLSFRANGKPLISLSMLGNTQQTGTPAPDNIIMPTFCGKLVGSDWTIPVTCGGQTTPVYLGQTQTVRRVKKLVLTGDENWQRQSGQTIDYFRLENMPATASKVVCTHYQSPDENIAYATIATGIKMQESAIYGIILACRPPDITTRDNFKAYLAQQYANGTPVTIWYAHTEPETGIVNEPLAKIGDYADELHIGNEVTIPTIKGQNTLTVDTDLQPSEMTITYTR